MSESAITTISAQQPVSCENKAPNKNRNNQLATGNTIAFMFEN